jgi:hypothetical protein
MIFNFNSPEEFTNFVCETAFSVQVMLSNQLEEEEEKLSLLQFSCHII